MVLTDSKKTRNMGFTLEWLGHAMFQIETSDGTRIVTDPYSDKTGYFKPVVEADIVTISHRHHDHSNTGLITGTPQIIDTPGRFVIGSVIIEGILSYHDEVKGEKRGENIIFMYRIDGLVIVHMGDYGQPITKEQLEALSGIDILLIPVGGTYTLDYEQAAKIIGLVKPKIAIPMHYKTKDCFIDIDPVDRFLQNVSRVKEKEGSITISETGIPEIPEVWVLSYRQ